MNEELIAPCGMNCGLCARYLASAHNAKSRGIKIPYCNGCRLRDRRCGRCRLLLKRQIQYCYECQDYPCDKLRLLDKRYRTFFKMSMIENLEYIKKHGTRRFLDWERERWKCPDCGEIICCHNGICFSCGLDRLKSKKKLYRWTD